MVYEAVRLYRFNNEHIRGQLKNKNILLKYNTTKRDYRYKVVDTNWAIEHANEIKNLSIQNGLLNFDKDIRIIDVSDLRGFKAGVNDLDTFSRIDSNLQEHLLLEYQPKNPKPINSICINSTEKVIWSCSKCGYEWKESVNSRTVHHGQCPRCKYEFRCSDDYFPKRKTVDRKTLQDWAIENGATDVLNEWSTKNKLKPDEVQLWSSERVLLLCSRCKHTYQVNAIQLYDNRLRSSRGGDSSTNMCPFCQDRNGQCLRLENKILLNLVCMTLGIDGSDVIIDGTDYLIDAYKFYIINIYSGLTDRATQKRAERAQEYIANGYKVVVLIDSYIASKVKHRRYSSEAIKTLSSILKKAYYYRIVDMKNYDVDDTAVDIVEYLKAVFNRHLYTDIQDIRRIIQSTKQQHFKLCVNKVPADKQLFNLYPELKSEWAYDLNGDIDTQLIRLQQYTRFWWRCPSCGNITFKQPILKVKNMYSCSVCGRKQARWADIEKARDQKKREQAELYFTEQYPDALRFWDYSKNTIDPATLTLASAKKIYLKCPGCGEQRICTVRGLVSQKMMQRCKKCSMPILTVNLPGQVAEAYPKLAALFQPDNIVKPNYMQPFQRTTVNLVCPHCRGTFSRELWAFIKSRRKCPLCKNTIDID